MTHQSRQIAAAENEPEKYAGGTAPRYEGNLCSDDIGAAPGWWLIPSVVAGALCWYALAKLVIGALS